MTVYQNQELTDFNFDNQNLQDSVFKNVTLTNCSFVNTNLKNCTFTNTNLTNSKFLHNNLTNLKSSNVSSKEITQMGQDITGEAAGDKSGYNVSINSDGTRVAIGAYLNDGAASDAGHVRVLEWDGVSWIKIGEDIAGEAANDRSGISVSINSDGTRVAIGARIMVQKLVMFRYMIGMEFLGIKSGRISQERLQMIEVVIVYR